MTPGIAGGKVLELKKVALKGRYFDVSPFQGLKDGIQ